MTHRLRSTEVAITPRHTHKYRPMNTQTYAHGHTHTYTETYTQKDTHRYMHANTLRDMHIYKHRDIHGQLVSQESNYIAENLGTPKSEYTVSRTKGTRSSQADQC